MPKPSLKAEFKSFTKGLITETSELNFPENAFREGENFELNKKGGVDRRLGFTYEANYAQIATSIPVALFNTSSVSFVKWESAGGNPDNDFVVVQVANRLFVFDTSVEFLSSDGLLTTIVLDRFSSATEFSVTNVKDSLVVACGLRELGLVKYITETNTFAVEYFTIKARDVWGVPCYEQPGYETDDSFRGGYDPNHLYNLYNQSWGIPRKVKGGDIADVTDSYFKLYGYYPSNSETVWPAVQFKADDTPTERVFPSMYKELFGSAVKAAKGYFIIDALERGTSREQEIVNNATKYENLTLTSIDLDRDTTEKGATVTAEFAGRVVYAGFNGETIGSNSRSPDFSDHIFFSQLINSGREYGRCYQEGDPTSRDGSDIVDTDGGFIRITGAKKIVGLRAVGNILVVLATNGVWAVIGGSDYGFSATNYKVNRLSVYGCVSSRSIVDDGERVLYWGNEGIFVVKMQETGDYSVSSLSENTIQTFYNAIPSTSKNNCVGVYDMLAKKIRWIYQHNGVFASGSVSKELVLDLNLGAFYPHTINHVAVSGAATTAVLAAVSMPAFKSSTTLDDIVVGSDDVVVLGELAITTTDILSSSEQSLQYLVVTKVGSSVSFSFGSYRNPEFKDWGVNDAAGFITTAHYTNNDSSVNKQIQCVTTHMKRTDSGIVDGDLITSSSCFLSTCWDWSDNTANGRWSREQQIYRLRRVYIVDDGEEYSPGSTVVSTKNKMRGTGLAFSMKFRTEAEKDCRLIGWSTAMNSNAYV